MNEMYEALTALADAAHTARALALLSDDERYSAQLAPALDKVRELAASIESARLTG